MNDPQQQEETLFYAALQLSDPGERAAYLKVACSDDEALRLRVEALLQAHEQKDAVLDKGTMPISAQSLVLNAAEFRPAEQAGDRIGRYKLLEKIGEGGCGVVYVAEQEEPVRRRVALKVIKLGMDTKQVIARFEAERQALALMDHPNIAKVLDAGATETGRPYFVMELVRGIRITDYCDQNNLSTEERLKLFGLVCQAIQHAHQKGIIHRDIKPSNILVTLHDGVPVPKVIDFGIAKATEGRLTKLTVYTELHQFIGTPAYMSPEQAEMSGLDIDTRSDIYALGVLLYELLTGTQPFDPKELLAAGLDAMRRTIREEEPARPSTRLSTMLDADLTSIAKHRQSDALKLVHLLRGDLDWIVMKALEKDRTRRYESASSFAADIARHLANEPVVAAPPSSVYRFRRFASRHRVALATSSAFVLLLLTGVLVSGWQAWRANRFAREMESQRTIANTEAARAKSEALKSAEIARFLTDMLEGVDPLVALGRDTKLMRDILDTTEARLASLKNQPEVEVELRLTLARVYRALGLPAKAEALIRQALAIRKEVFRDEGIQVAQTMCALAIVLWEENKIDEAESLQREALRRLISLRGKQHADVAVSLNNLSACLAQKGSLAEAEEVMREALAIRQKLSKADDQQITESMNNLAGILATQGRKAEAGAIFADIVKLQRERFPDGHPDLARALKNLAGFRMPSEAEALCREALVIEKKFLGHEHPDVAVTLRNLAETLRQQNKFSEAESFCLESLVIRKKLFGSEDVTLADSLHLLGVLLTEQGSRLPDAETAHRDALAIRVKAFADSHPSVGESYHGLGKVLKAEYQFTEAEKMFRSAITLRKKLLGPGHPQVAESLFALAELLAAQNILDEPEKLFSEAVAIRRKLPGQDDPHLVKALDGWATLLWRKNRRAEAEALWREAAQLAHSTKEQKVWLQTRIARNDRELPPGVVAAVDGFAVTEVVLRDLMSEAEQAIRRRYTNNPSVLAQKLMEARTAAAAQAINGQLLLNEFYGDPMINPLKFVANHIHADIKNKFFGDTNLFFKTLAAEGITLQQYGERVLQQEFRSRLFRNVPPPAEAEIQQYYWDHQKDYWVDEMIELSLLKIDKQFPGSTPEEQKQLADQIRAQLAPKAELEEIVKKFPGKGTHATVYGWVTRKMLNERIAHAAFALEPTNLSEVVEEGDTLYIARVSGRRPAGPKPLEEVREKILATIKHKAQHTALETLLRTLRMNAVIVQAPDPRATKPSN